MNKPSDEIVATHDFRNDIPCCKVCKRCGMAMHKTSYEGFKYWYAGVGYHEPLPCAFDAGYSVKRGE